MLIIHYWTFLYANLTALIEATNKNIFKMHFIEGALYVND